MTGRCTASSAVTVTPCTANGRYPGYCTLIVYVSSTTPAIVNTPFASVFAEYEPEGEAAVTTAPATGLFVSCAVTVPTICPVDAARAGGANGNAKASVSKRSRSAVRIGALL